LQGIRNEVHLERISRGAATLPTSPLATMRAAGSMITVA